MIKKLIGAAFILGVALFAALYVHIRDHGIHLAPDAFIEKAGDRDNVGTISSLVTRVFETARCIWSRGSLNTFQRPSSIGLN
jgi:hypothetical protein